MAGKMRLLHTQLGYRPAHGRKRILAPDRPGARGLFGEPVFWGMEQNEFSEHALHAPNQPDFTYRAVLRRERTDFGNWLVGGISGLRGNGVCRAFLGSDGARLHNVGGGRTVHDNEVLPA